MSSQRTVSMPSKIRALPRNNAGYPIPFFAGELGGKRDFRIMSPRAWQECVLERACWICGQRRRKKEDVFVLGPMCAINRTTAEPPCHLECAEYAAQVCPFLANPSMVRRETGLPDNPVAPGIMIRRNPGVALLWNASTWSTYRPAVGQGQLFNLGDPVQVTWWAHGRAATRAEVLASIESGMGALEAACDIEPDPAGARRALRAYRVHAMQYLPKR